MSYFTGLKVNKVWGHKIVNIFLSISITFVLGAQKNCLINTVLLEENSENYFLIMQHICFR